MKEYFEDFRKIQKNEINKTNDKQMINKIQILKLARKYFKTFSNKDIGGLEKMFTKDIKLLAFDGEAIGIENVLNVNKQIFNSVNEIEVKPLNVFVDEKKKVAVGDLIINTNGSFALKVVDILIFTDKGKIKTIKAYKG